jgi:hypothetical protein
LFLFIFCLVFTQTAQAYSLAWLPYKYQHTSTTNTETLSTDGLTIQAKDKRCCQFEGISNMHQLQFKLVFLVQSVI